MATTIPQLADALHTVFTTVAEEAGQQSGFVQRRVKWDGSTFSQALVFGWLAEPDATLEELCQTAALLGVTVSPQGLDYRFTPKAAACLERVLGSAIRQVLAANPVAIPLLQRFQGVYIQDSSLIRLPAALAAVWPGCGGSTSGWDSALKVQVRLEFSTGALQGPCLQAGRRHDRTGLALPGPVPPKALLLTDLGYFSLDRLAAEEAQGVYWLSRLQAGTAIWDQEGRRWRLSALLQAQASNQIDWPMQVGVQHHLPCRLLAVRVSQEVADRRRQRLYQEARRRQQPVTAEQLALADWTILVTNLPVNLLSLPEALVLARTRWQIELVFKLWKSQGHLDTSRSHKPWRVLCEVYAKLLALLVQHWLTLVSCWRYPDRSLVKAAQTIRKHAIHLIVSLLHPEQLAEAITLIEHCLMVGCRLNRRKAAPNNYQLLLNASGEP